MVNERTVLLIGAGQLGSRHLQALKKVDMPLSIIVVDPSQPALQLSRQRYDEVVGRTEHRVTFTQSLESIPLSIDVCIIACTSDIRAKITHSLFAHSNCKYLIFEKVLFQTLDEYNEINTLLDNKNVTSFVNCPRRCVPFYQSFVNLLRSEKGNKMMSVIGGEWGLACNSIHYIDLAAMLFGCSEYTMDTSGLDNEIHASKRSGFSEVTGMLKGVFNNGDIYSLSAQKGSSAPPVVSIVSGDMMCICDETNGIARIMKKSGNWVVEEVKFSIAFQSDLTKIVVEKILRDGTCELTPYSESERLHLPLIRGLTHHFAIVSGSDNFSCPIT